MNAILHDLAVLSFVLLMLTTACINVCGSDKAMLLTVTSKSLKQQRRAVDWTGSSGSSPLYKKDQHGQDLADRLEHPEPLHLQHRTHRAACMLQSHEQLKHSQNGRLCIRRYRAKTRKSCLDRLYGICYFGQYALHRERPLILATHDAEMPGHDQSSRSCACSLHVSCLRWCASTGPAHQNSLLVMRSMTATTH